MDGTKRAQTVNGGSMPSLFSSPKMPVITPPPLQADADAIAKAKTANLMASMAKSGRSSTDLTGQSDKLGG